MTAETNQSRSNSNLAFGHFINLIHLRRPNERNKTIKQLSGFFEASMWARLNWHWSFKQVQFGALLMIFAGLPAPNRKLAVSLSKKKCSFCVFFVVKAFRSVLESISEPFAQLKWQILPSRDNQNSASGVEQSWLLSSWFQVQSRIVVVVVLWLTFKIIRQQQPRRHWKKRATTREQEW